MTAPYFISLLLAAGVCAAFAIHAATLWHQTKNRQFVDLFALAALEGVYCLVAHEYLRETDSARALPWGQSICAFTPFITYFFGQLVLSLSVNKPRWLPRFQRVSFWLTAAFAAAVVVDMATGSGFVIEPVLRTDLTSAHRHRLTFTAFGNAYLGFVSCAFTLFTVLLFRAYRARNDLFPMVAGCILYFLATILDFGILTDLRDGYFVQHFGFFALVASCWRVLARRFERSVEELQGAVLRLEDERRRLLTAAPMLQKQKLDGLGTLAAAIAHEINNPVQGILNYSTILRRSLAAGSSEVGYLDKLDREAERVARIVRSLLLFGRADREEPTIASLSDLIQTVLTLTETAILRDGILLRVHIPEDLPPLQCHPHQLQQVLLNLVTNARDAVNYRGPGRTDEKRIDLDARWERRTGVPWVKIAVSDTGDGVDPNLADRIFDPFFTTKAETGGTGLGLSISSGIVEAHGGRLRLLGGSRRGATFVAELPAGTPKSA